MKKMLYAIAALLAAAACSQQPEHQAQALLDEARTALEQNDYQTALTLVDSLSRTYPKAFDQRHEALKLKQEAALKQAQQELAAVDSMLEAVKRAYAGRLEVHIGMELGLIPDDVRIAREAEALARDWPWEFIIGSTHLIPVRIGGQVYNVDPADPAEVSRTWYHFNSVKALMSVYFETVLKNLEQFDFYDTVGHIDYMSRYMPRELAPYRYEDHAEQIDRILQTAIRKGIAVEVNTGGLYKGMGKTNPEDRILRRYLELGGRRLTFGSDAHRPEQVGYGFETLPDYG